jgi:RimJ/RimL family protein N-acetyltransferase
MAPSIIPECVETPRLILREWQVEDVEALAEAITESIEHLRPWMPWVAFEPLTIDARREFILGAARTRSEGGEAVYGIFLDGLPIGGTGLHRRAGPDVLEIGYWIRVGYTRRGYAAEASAALTEVAFTVDGIARVEIRHDRGNEASRNVPRSLGFELVREEERTSEAPAEIGVDCIWEMTAPLWAELQDAGPAARER